MVAFIEQGMYRLSDIFMAPVLCLIVLFFIYTLFATGQFIAQGLQRRSNFNAFNSLTQAQQLNRSDFNLLGYPLAMLANERRVNSEANITKDMLDVQALKELEGVRNASRIAPMLGLIATMIPMGPALKSLSDGNIQGISENLIVAFSAVIFGLVIASVTFWIASVKKRWLAEELVVLFALIDQQDPKNDEDELSKQEVKQDAKKDAEQMELACEAA